MSKTDEIATRLRAGLEGVTPGPWLSSASVVLHGFPSKELCSTTDRNGAYNSNDATHIANCDPQSILVILDERDRMKTALEPFAGFASELDMEKIPDAVRIAYGAFPRITAGDCRRARAALEGKL